MATYYARLSGNINAANIWATTPSGTAAAVTFASGDVLVANSFTVTVNVSVDIGSAGQVRNDTFGGATNGGGFVLKPNQTLTATVITGTIASCLTFADAGSTYVVGTINANATNVSTSGLVNNSSTGTVFVTGNIVGSSGGANATGITNSVGGVINVTGSVLGAQGTAMRNSAGGTIIVTGPVEAGLGASGFGHGILNAAAGTIQVVGNVTASSNLPAISSTSASSVVRVSGSFIHAVNGQVPIASNRVLLNTTPTLAITRYAVNGAGTYFDMFTADNSLGQANPSDVRSGVSYGGGNLTGTCAVPAAGSVALGVPVDAGYGTAVLTPEAVWGHASRTITEGGITAADVWSHASRTVTGGTVDTLTNAPSVPTPAQIASQVRTELATELARVDVATSTRLAGSAYTAPANSDITAIKSKTDNLPASPAATGDIPSANITAIKAKTDLLNTDRLAQVSTVATTGAQLAAALS